MLVICFINVLLFVQKSKQPYNSVVNVMYGTLRCVLGFSSPETCMRLGGSRTGIGTLRCVLGFSSPETCMRLGGSRL